MSRLIISLIKCLFLALPGALQAQEQPRTILVLDASGSMWGQIDGKAKITIAQEVVARLLKTIPPEQALGLTAYGHRRKGDCGDIETLVAPSTGSRAAIERAVNAIKPKGKTPLSAAVIAAAEELKYTEEAATVILVSDGRETCNVDTCEVGRQLEEAGVDFTAHVIGFDIAKRADREQLQCLAENTGGTFKTASNAAELTEALKVVAKPQPPSERAVRFVAIEGEGGRSLTEGLRWTLRNLDDGTVHYDLEAAARLDTKLLPGSYLVEVLRTENETTAEKTIQVFKNTDTTITLVLPLIIPEAELSGVATAPVGSTIEMQWSGPDDEGDYLATAPEGSDEREYITYSYTRHGAPLALRVPPTPGVFEIRYYNTTSGRVLARKTLEVTPLEAVIDLPDEVFAGQTVEVNWTGPDYESDYLSAAIPGAKKSEYLTYSYTRRGAPLALDMPAEPGDYEIRYVMALGPTVLGRKLVSVKPVSATLDAPPTAAAGETLAVSWEGPNYNGDYLSVAKSGDASNRYVNYRYTRNGSPAGLAMPTEPGNYEIRYVMRQGQTVLATRQIEVKEISAELITPAKAKVGEPVEIVWQGPDYQGDFLAVGLPGESGYSGYVYTRHGSPTRLAMPLVPGTYEIRYVQNQDNFVLSRQLIEVEPLEVSLEAPAVTTVGKLISVNWDGPNYERDYIVVASVGAKDREYHYYSYTRNGAALELQMPAIPGDYEIRYIANGSPDRMLGSIPVRVNGVDMQLIAPATATAGGRLDVSVDYVAHPRDYVAIGRPGDKGYEKYAYVGAGGAVAINLPEQPGEYEIRYVLRAGDTVIAKRLIVLE